MLVRRRSNGATSTAASNILSSPHHPSKAQSSTAVPAPSSTTARRMKRSSSPTSSQSSAMLDSPLSRRARRTETKLSKSKQASASVLDSPLRYLSDEDIAVASRRPSSDSIPPAVKSVLITESDDSHPSSASEMEEEEAIFGSEVEEEEAMNEDSDEPSASELMMREESTEESPMLAPRNKLKGPHRQSTLAPVDSSPLLSSTSTSDFDVNVWRPSHASLSPFDLTCDEYSISGTTDPTRTNESSSLSHSSSDNFKIDDSVYVESSMPWSTTRHWLNRTEDDSLMQHQSSSPPFSGYSPFSASNHRSPHSLLRQSLSSSLTSTNISNSTGPLSSSDSFSSTFGGVLPLDVDDDLRRKRRRLLTNSAADTLHRTTLPRDRLSMLETFRTRSSTIQTDDTAAPSITTRRSISSALSHPHSSRSAFTSPVSTNEQSVTQAANVASYHHFTDSLSETTDSLLQQNSDPVPMQLDPVAPSSSALACSGSPPSSASSPSPVTYHPIPANYLRCAEDRADTTAISNIIKRVYGLTDEEMGHRTLGHSCLSREDVQHAASGSHDLLYGECLPIGATKMFDRAHLDLRAARTVCDLGSGIGKLAIQAFLQYPNLQRVFGCELSRSRFQKSSDAIAKLYEYRLEYRRYCAQQRTRAAAAAMDGSDNEDMEEQKSGPSCYPSRLPVIPRVALHQASLRSPNSATKHTTVKLSESISKSLPMMQSSGNSVESSWTNLLTFEEFVLQLTPPPTTPAASILLNTIKSLDDDENGVNDTSSSAVNSDRVARTLSRPYSSTRQRATSSAAPSGDIRRGLASSFTIDSTRSLELFHLNLFEMADAFDADVVICETKFNEDNYPALCKFLSQFKRGCRLLTYENLDLVYQSVYGDAPPESKEDTESDESFGMNITTRSAETEQPLSGTVDRLIAKHGGSASKRAIGASVGSPSSAPPVSSSLESLRSLSPCSSPIIRRPVVERANNTAYTTGVSTATSNNHRESKRKRMTSDGNRKGSADDENSSTDVAQSASIASLSPPISSLSSLTVAGSHVVAAASDIAPATTAASSSSSPSVPVPPHHKNPFKQLAINLSKSDRFYTTWATNLGHHFFIWQKQQ